MTWLDRMLHTPMSDLHWWELLVVIAVCGGAMWLLARARRAAEAALRRDRPVP